MRDFIFALLASVSMEYQSFTGLLWWGFYAVRYSVFVSKVLD